MLSDQAVKSVREAHRRFERARERIWIDRVRVGLEHRRALRAIDEAVAEARLKRDRRLRETVAGGASYREVGRAVGLSHSRIQQIVNAGSGSGTRAKGER